MKKLLLLSTILMALSSTTLAQTSPIKLGIKAGATFPTFGTSGPGSEDANVSISTSFYFGGTVDIAIDKTFSIQPGILFIGKGAKESASASTTIGGITYSERAEATANPYYIEIPVNLIANFKTNSGSFFVGAGPYYALGVAGKIKMEYYATSGGVTNSEKTEEDIKFGNNTGSHLKSGDFGINFLVGYEFSNKFNIHTGYGLGLSNINSSESGLKTGNRVISLGLGFSF